jgi:hypothetical protein
MTTKQDLYRLIDALPEGALPTAARSLAALQAQEAALPAFLRNTPVDDPEPDEIAALATIDEAEPSISNTEMKRAFGL